MNRKSRKIIRIIIYVLLWTGLAACFALWVDLARGVIQSCWYKYPAIKNWFSLLGCIMSLLLPICILIRFAIVLLRGNPKKAFVHILIYIPVYMISFLLSAAIILGIPAICSYSTNLDDFGTYDARPSEILITNPPICFPDILPENAKDVRYIYYYQNASAETLYIAVSWQSSEKEIRSLTTNLEQYTMNQTHDNQVRVLCTGGYYNNAVFIDYEDHRVCYVLTSPWMSLPYSIYDVYTMPLGS